MSNVSTPELDALAELHASDLPMSSRILVGCIIVSGEGRVSCAKALAIYEGLIWPVLAHPAKTIRAIHAAREAALLTDSKLNAIANQGDKCLEQ
jgi:hypothetical protein